MAIMDKRFYEKISAEDFEKMKSKKLSAEDLEMISGGTEEDAERFLQYLMKQYEVDNLDDLYPYLTYADYDMWAYLLYDKKWC